MLNESRILSYIKTNIGFPWQFIEMEDSEILDYVKEYSIREFTQYFPDINIIGLSLQYEGNRVQGKANEYYIEEPNGREILNVCNIYFSGSNLYLHGHPPLGPMSLGEIGNWILSSEVASWVKTLSNWNYTYVFKSPNIIRISPTPISEDWVAVEYERQHADDFSTIPNELQMYFCELCLADIMMVIGRIRKKFADGNLKTPFGDIPLESTIYDEGKEKKQAIIEKLSSGALTNVVVSFG